MIPKHHIGLEMRMEVFLANVFFILSKDERRVYRLFNQIERVLNNGNDSDELRVCKDEKLREAYGLYADCDFNRFKPYFYAKLHDLAARVNERVKALDSDYSKS